MNSGYCGGIEDRSEDPHPPEEPDEKWRDRMIAEAKEMVKGWGRPRLEHLEACLMLIDALETELGPLRAAKMVGKLPVAERQAAAVGWAVDRINGKDAA